MCQKISQSEFKEQNECLKCLKVKKLNRYYVLCEHQRWFFTCANYGKAMSGLKSTYVTSTKVKMNYNFSLKEQINFSSYANMAKLYINNYSG